MLLKNDKKLVVLFCLFILIGELHNCFRSDSVRAYDVFILLDFSLDLEWIVKQVCDKIQLSILALALYIKLRNQIKIFALVILGFTVFDIIMYFVNYNSNPYYSLAYMAISIVLYLVFK